MIDNMNQYDTKLTVLERRMLINEVDINGSLLPDGLLIDARSVLNDADKQVLDDT